MNRRFFLLVPVLFALAACAALHSHDKTHRREARSREAHSYRLVGYVTDKADPARIPAEKLTVLDFAFAKIDANGEVVLQRAEDGDFLASLRALKQRNPRLKVLVSVGGWGADGFSDAALSIESRERFADSAARLLAREQLDGIDIDWEYPTLPGPGIVHRPDDKQDFTLMLEALRTRLDALALEQRRGRDAPYLISAALGDREFVAGIELDRVGRVLDWINLMTYDFHNSLTPTTGHASGLARSSTSAPNERTVESAVQQFIDAGVPARKLVVGVPFYGHVFADVNAQNRGLDQPYGHHGDAPAWPRLAADFIDRNGYARYWDDAAHEPYLWNPQKREFVSYDDPRSLALKAEFAKTHRLGGMMYWEQSQDPDGELLGVIAAKLR